MLDLGAHVARELAYDGLIQHGDSGKKVRRVQEWLKVNRFATGIDGAFGDATEKCVGNFQQTKGITKTGKVNQQTWEALTEPLSKALAPAQFSAGTKTSPSGIARRQTTFSSAPDRSRR